MPDDSVSPAGPTGDAEPLPVPGGSEAAAEGAPGDGAALDTSVHGAAEPAQGVALPPSPPLAAGPLTYDAPAARQVPEVPVDAGGQAVVDAAALPSAPELAAGPLTYDAPGARHVPDVDPTSGATTASRVDSADLVAASGEGALDGEAVVPGTDGGGLPGAGTQA